MNNIHSDLLRNFIKLIDMFVKIIGCIGIFYEIYAAGIAASSYAKQIEVFYVIYFWLEYRRNKGFKYMAYERNIIKGR